MERDPLLPQKRPEKNPSSFWGGTDGALGWTVATAIMLINFITIGLGRMSGILYVDFMREYRVNRQLASAPFSVQQSTRNLFGPLVGLLGHTFGIRSVTVVGGLMGAGSAAACAYAAEITWITVFWGGLYGTGIAFTSTLSQVILDDYFERNLSSASGLSFSGGSVGAMVFSFALQSTIDDYGLKNAYLIMGAVILLVVPLAITLTTPPWLKVQSEGGRLRNKTNFHSNARLKKSLSTADILSVEKGFNKSLDKTQILNSDPSYTAFKRNSQNDVKSRGSFDKKNDSYLPAIYGTFEKNDLIQSNADQGLSLPGPSSSRQNSFENSVDMEKENIAKFMASIEELYTDSKARVSKSSSQESTDDEFSIRNSNRKKTNAKKKCSSTIPSEKTFPPKNQDFVDSSVVSDSVDSNLSATTDDRTSVATSEVDKKAVDQNPNLSSSKDLTYKLLYLRTNFQCDFPDLSFPKKVNNTILDSSEIDSVKTLDGKQDGARLSTLNDDFQSVANVEGFDTEFDKITSSNITDDKGVESDVSLCNKDEQSGISKNIGSCSPDQTPSFFKNSSIIVDESKSAVEGNELEVQGSLSSDKRTTATERNAKPKSTSLVNESPSQQKSSWKERSLPSKLPSNEQWGPSKSRSSNDRPRNSCCLVPHSIQMVLKLYLNPAFLVICLCRAVHLLTFMGVLTIIVDFSMDRGLLESDGKYAVTAMSLGDLIGRLCTGWVTDCMFIGLEKFMLIAMLLIGLISISLPLIPPSTVLLLVCVYSILQGSVFIRHPILVSKYTRTEERTVGMGFMTLFSGLLGFLMPIYIGHFRDGLGSYNPVFYINGAVCAGIGLLWLFEPCLKKFIR